MKIKESTTQLRARTRARTHKSSSMSGSPRHRPPLCNRSKCRDGPEGDIADAPQLSPTTSSSYLAVKLRVEAVPIWCTSGCLKSAALGITTKKKALLAREFFSFQYSAIFQKDARACGDITARFDDTIVTQ